MTVNADTNNNNFGWHLDIDLVSVPGAKMEDVNGYFY